MSSYITESEHTVLDCPGHFSNVHNIQISTTLNLMWTLETISLTLQRQITQNIINNIRHLYIKLGSKMSATYQHEI